MARCKAHDILRRSADPECVATTRGACNGAAARLSIAPPGQDAEKRARGGCGRGLGTAGDHGDRVRGSRRCMLIS